MNDLAFCRSLLKAVIQEVKSHGLSSGHVRNAWVHQTGNQWEFHFGDYYWWGKAENAYDARAKGWSAWLTKHEVAK